jgi:hypothetical protein
LEEFSSRDGLFDHWSNGIGLRDKASVAGVEQATAWSQRCARDARQRIAMR